MKIKGQKSGGISRVLLAVLLPALLLSCSCDVKTPELRIPWQEGEIAVMEVSREGELLFYDESRIEEEEGLLLYRSEYQYTSAPLERRIYLDPETLLPRRNETIFTAADGRAGSLEVIYGEEEIRVKKSGPKEGTTALPLPKSPCFDNDQFMLLVRALPLEADWEGQIRLFVPATVQIVTINLKVLRQEEIAVGAGTFDCHMVELMDLGQRAWVGIEPPCPLVKYVNDSAGTLTELVEYYPGGEKE